MNQQTQNRIAITLGSFLGMGLFIVLLVIGVIFFSYLLIIGGIVGLVLFGVAYLRSKFLRRHTKQPREHHGRTIDQKK